MTGRKHVTMSPSQVVAERIERLAQKSPEELTNPEALKLARELGPLASWLLKPEVLEKARLELAAYGWPTEEISQYRKPYLPDGPGACWVVAVRKDTCYPALRDSIVLPLRWQEGLSEKPPILPEGLQEVADEVVRELKASRAIAESDQWELHPASDNLFDPGLPFLKGDYSSAWAPLAGALILAANKGKPDHKVWATGAWDRQAGVIRVEGIREKLAVAKEFHASQFFVPASCSDEACQWVRENNWPIEIKTFERSTPRPHEALRPYKLQLRVPASKSDPPEERAATYLDISSDHERRKYYLDCILEDLANELRNQFSKEPEKLQCRYFITIVSDSPELIYLMHFVFRPRKSLILYTQESQSNRRNESYPKLAAEVEEWLKSPEVQKQLGSSEPRVEAFPDGDLEELVRRFRSLVDELLQGDDPRSLVIDVTPGKKIMSIAWTLAAPKGARLVYVDSKFAPAARKPQPFTERLTIFSLDTLSKNDSSA